MLVQLLYGLRSRLLWWVEEGEIADEHHVLLVLDGKVVLLAQETLLRQSQHAHTQLVHLLHEAQRFRTHLLCQRQHLAVELGMRAHAEHLLHSALCDDLSLAAEVLHHYRHTAALEVERYLVHLLVRTAQRLQSQLLHVRENGTVHEVIQSCLEVAIEVSVAQNAVCLVLRAIHVHVSLQHDVVLRQRARLVGAENIHRAEVLNGVKVLHDSLLARHGKRTLREVRRHDHRQHLRRQTHSHGYGEDERLHPVALRDAVHQKHDRHHYEHEAYEQQTHLRDATVERRSRTMSRHALRYSAEVGVVARSEHDTLGRTAHHVRAHEADIIEVNDAARVLARLRERGELLYRVGLARQTRLAHE